MPKKSVHDQNKALQLKLGEFLSRAFVEKALQREIKPNVLERIRTALNDTLSTDSKFWAEWTIGELMVHKHYAFLFQVGYKPGYGGFSIRIFAELMMAVDLVRAVPTKFHGNPYKDLSPLANEILKNIKAKT